MLRVLPGDTASAFLAWLSARDPGTILNHCRLLVRLVPTFTNV